MTTTPDEMQHTRKAIHTILQEVAPPLFTSPRPSSSKTHLEGQIRNRWCTVRYDDNEARITACNEENGTYMVAELLDPNCWDKVRQFLYQR